jgi:hypothetical protein
VKYIQYIASDLTQLNSDVVRAFKREFFFDENPSLPEVVNGEVDFYAHCVTKLGVLQGVWEKVGNIQQVGNVNDILFRSSGDYGNPAIKISHNWWLWTINNSQVRIGTLEGDNQKAEIGTVVPPKSIIYRMKNGKYPFSYPDFK